MSRIAALVLPGLAFLVIPLFCHSASPDASWTYRLNPGLTGAPSIKARTSGVATDVITTISVLTAETSGVLSEEITRTTTTLVVNLPEVAEDTFMEIAIGIGLDNQAEVFRWRTLARPADKPLMQYSGQQRLLPPKDFDKYWADAKKELATIPLAPKVSREEDCDTTTGLLFRVELESVQSTSIIGWLFIPREAYPDGHTELPPIKRFPAILIAPGFGGDQRPVDRTAEGFVTFAINPRNHGPSRAFWKAPVDHLMYNITDCENYYYKLAYLDCLRAAEFLFSRDEIDPERVGAEGSSQGGLFALATAALEPRIACVSVNVLGFSDIPDGSILALRGHHVAFRTLLDESRTTAPLVSRSLSYIDGANMVTRIKCPVQINMAGKDPVSPYVCGIVVYNRLPKGVEREFNLDPDAEHQLSKQMAFWTAAWRKRWLGK